MKRVLSGCTCGACVSRSKEKKKGWYPESGKCRLVGSTRPGQQRTIRKWKKSSVSFPSLSPSIFLPLSSSLSHSPPLSAVITAQTAPYLRLMDHHHNLIRNIFSRKTSPPISTQSYPEEQSPSAQHFPQFQHVSPAQSLQDVTPSSPPAHLESLFSNLTSPGQSSGNPNTVLQGSTQPTTTATSGPTSPASSITALSAPTNMSTSTNTPPNATLSGDSRQSALLSLLGSVSPTGSSSSGAPQQVPTPPAASNRGGPVASNNNESQGRLLLEQLMAG